MVKIYIDITNEKQNKMFAKNDLNSVALNMSIVRLQLNSLMTMDWIDTEIFKSWQEQQKRSSTTFEKMLVTYSSVYFFLNYYIYMLIFDIWKWLEKIGRFYCWFLFHNAYQRNFLLEKVKNYFPQSKVTTHCSLHPVANWFGIWGKRSHWPCVMEGLLLWGKSWVRLFILVTSIFFFIQLFSQSQG